MSWCGGGEIRPTPGIECRTRAITSIHFVPGQLSAFARLGALRNLDLQVVRIHQIIDGHAESRRSHLLDRAAPQIAVGIRP